jgi:hypothetical protein
VFLSFVAFVNFVVETSWRSSRQSADVESRETSFLRDERSSNRGAWMENGGPWPSNGQVWMKNSAQWSSTGHACQKNSSS